MAQVVGYHEDNVVFEEGPFVAVEVGGWRIEAEFKGHKCPVLPDFSIYRLLAREGKHGGKYPTSDLGTAQIKETVDWLNQLVKDGEIRLWNGTTWVYPPLAD